MMQTSTSAGRYLSLIEATLRVALTTPRRTELSSDGTFELERVLPAVAVRLGYGDATGSEPMIMAAAKDLAAASRVVDRAGHSRPVYAALAVRALGRDADVEQYESTHRRAIAALADGAMAITAHNGGAVVAATFAAWAIHSISPTRDSAAALTRLAAAQQPDGTLLARTDADAPEPRWYDELALLHALSCHANECEDAAIRAAADRAVRYHAAETQPDHASSHPWAIAGFLNEPDAVPLADMMLHAAGVQSPETMDAVALLLLADALDCGRREGTQ